MGFLGIWLFVWLLATGCAESGNGDPSATDVDTDVDMDTDADSDSESELPAKWTIETIEGDNAGLDAEAVVTPSGEVAVAYFSSAITNGELCEEVESDNKPERVWHELRLATQPATGGAWSVELIDTPLYPSGTTGLGLAVDASGNPVVAYRGGAPEQNYCGAGDAYLATRRSGGWQLEPASTSSGDSASGVADSDSGFAVGWWPALAFDPAGDPAILHQDTHFAYLQSDDKRRADAEFSWRQGGGWLHEAVDPGQGAGEGGAVVFDAQGRPVVFYFNPVSDTSDQYGAYAARRNDDGTWARIKIHDGRVDGVISAAMDPVYDEPVAAFYSAADYAVKIRRLTDDERFEDIAAWDSEIVKDTRYDEGQDVSLAFTPSGNMALAYHRCKRYDPAAAGCDKNDEALVFAVKTGGAWRLEIVRDNDLSCGMYASLAIGADGVAHIAFRCTVEVFDEYAFELLMATRDLGELK